MKLDRSLLQRLSLNRHLHNSPKFYLAAEETAYHFLNISGRAAADFLLIELLFIVWQHSKKNIKIINNTLITNGHKQTSNPLLLSTLGLPLGSLRDCRYRILWGTLR